jgi:transposase-like protein
MFKPIAQEIRDQIITRIKNNGEAVSKLSDEYSVSAKTIYGWLRKQSDQSVNFLEHARLKRENKLLLEIVGKLTLEKNQTSSFKKG